MCGRFTLAARPEELFEEFPDFEFTPEVTPRYNIAPTQDVLVLPDDGRHEARFMRWGLIPFWAREASVGNRMINARAETILEKAAFRHAFRKKRCLVPADGFFEWKSQGRDKQPFHVALEGGRPFAMAGLWETWSPPGAEPIPSFTILTTEANDTVRPLHDRMPVLLPAEVRQAWLDPGSDPERLLELLVPYRGPMTLRPVSRFVNQARNEGPACLEPPEA